MLEWKSGEKIDKDIVSKVEKELNIKFPDDYINCVLKNNGGRPSLSTFDFEEHKEMVFNYLLGLHPEDEEYVIKIYNWISDRLLPDIIPFANDPFGNYLCFDYRKSSQPEIVFWDHELAGMDKEKCISKVCDTFSELLSKLY